MVMGHGAESMFGVDGNRIEVEKGCEQESVASSFKVRRLHPAKDPLTLQSVQGWMEDWREYEMESETNGDGLKNKRGEGGMMWLDMGT
jgi:hypothetical protein